MHEHRTDPDADLFPCFGCSKLVPVDPRYHRLRAWCAACHPFASDFYAVERVGRLLARYGLNDAARAVAAAIASMREQLRTGASPVRAIAAERERKEEQYSRERAASESYEMAQDKLNTLRPDLRPCDVNPDLFAAFDLVRAWPVIVRALEATRGDETAEEVLARALEHLRAAAREDPRLWAPPIRLHPRRPRSTSRGGAMTPEGAE